LDERGKTPDIFKTTAHFQSPEKKTTKKALTKGFYEFVNSNKSGRPKSSNTS
jgi:hypothetical protein